MDIYCLLEAVNFERPNLILTYVTNMDSAEKFLHCLMTCVAQYLSINRLGSKMKEIKNRETKKKEIFKAIFHSISYVRSPWEMLQKISFNLLRTAST